MTLEHTLRQIQKSKFWKNEKMLLIIGIGLFLNLLTWLLVLVRFSGFKQAMSLHMSFFSGIDSIGPWIKLLILPLFSLGILIVHFILIFHFYALRREDLSRLLVLSLLFIQIISLTAILIVVGL